MTEPRIIATYHIASDADRIEQRAQGLAIEQSVECPLEAIGDPAILDTIVGRVEDIVELQPGRYAVRVGLAAATAPAEPGQLLNMLFGNSAIQDDVALADVALPDSYLAAFGGPRVGLAGIRALTGASQRALTASALKPQGLSPAALAGIAEQLARGGVDLIKDDHGLADQAFSPFAARAVAVGQAVREANAASGGRTLYAPNISGTLDDMRRQLSIIREEGIGALLVAPMIVGLSNFHAIVKEAAGLVVVAHPAMAGAVKIAPPLLLGRLFRLLGADATVFPNYGGRFAYSTDTCRALAAASRDPWDQLNACMPVPAGGIMLHRVNELLQFYGQDVMLLIGGSLLAAREQLTEQASRFVDRVASHGQR
ncbi:ribulose-bisphosphate carboxylase large chain [Rhodopseudomonas rhenobacensis]|uniref:Ribulose-bisphosphate carboxylase large chain n=1 Tax=Rhodopseudomonas rhenobacensis TaxID=87461 RepID=A0A7W7Z544_9BRAD|nr:RuBisCO large subunit C-terminal-like domain-containing protein [Rhodopseudomonas rhenobacensis]MBB5048187.1 ribulose-bisphosphate carboxylase large chain [Rhodopseudomonas rhenobacensis]